MTAFRLASRNVTRRLGTLVFVTLPATLLFAMLTFLSASEATVRQLTAPGIHQRAFRIGTIDGLSWSAASFSKADVVRLGSVPGAHMAPYSGQRCSVDPAKPEDLRCGSTTRAYVEIWAMNQTFTPEQLDAWERLPNGALVTRAVATLHGWKLGDHISLTYNNPLYNGVDVHEPLELVVAGITDTYIDPSMIYFHEAYFDERYHASNSYWVVWCLVDAPEARAAMMAAMETKLREMAHPYVMWPMEMTEAAILTGSEVLRESFRVAGLASFFVVVCVGVTLLIISIERRRSEFAVLLAIGFPRRTLAASILLEGVFLVLPGALLGAIAVFVPFHTTALAFDSIFRVWIHVSDVVVTGFIGLSIGLGAALIPALRVYRVNVLGALR